MKKETTIKSMRLEKSTIEAIKKIAKKENRTFTNMVEVILQKSIKHKDLILSLK